MYTPVLDSLNTTLTIHRWNASTAIPTTLASGIQVFPQPIMNLMISVLKISIRVSFTVIPTGVKIQLNVRKSDMFIQQVSGVSLQTAGIYLNTYDLYLYHETAEIMIQNPETTNTEISRFTTPTSSPETIKYLCTQD